MHQKLHVLILLTNYNFKSGQLHNRTIIGFVLLFYIIILLL